MIISAHNPTCPCSNRGEHGGFASSIERQLQEMMMTLLQMQGMMMGVGQGRAMSRPNWGHQQVPNNPGLGGFLGSGNSIAPLFRPQTSGNSSWMTQPGAVTPSSNLRTNGSATATLMNSIQRSPIPPGCSRGGYCYRGVKHHLRQIGVNLTGGSAYMAADQLARSGRFREVRVPRSQLRSLPAGAVVVWNRGAGKPHGHISIANGRGQEASGRIRNQITNYPTSHRVFLPR